MTVHMMDNQVSLRRFLLQAAACASNEKTKATLEQVANSPTTPELKRLLHQTSVAQYYAHSQPLPRSPWPTTCCMTMNELMAIVIERLLVRRRRDPEDSNVLALGYREATPGSTGHRLATSNTVMCYYPNTLVATFKQPQWVALHECIGDDLMVHLLLNYCVFVKTPGPQQAFVQLAGKSVRWMKKSSAQRGAVADKATNHRAPVSHSQHEVVTINQVMYARHFRKRRLFAQSDLANSTDSHDEVTRGQATRLVKAIFREPMKTKRLPRRLVNLVPLVQELMVRACSLRVEKVVERMVPIPRDVRDRILSDYRVRHVLSASRAGVPVGATSSRTDEDGYISQPESPSSIETRKRKRHEQAVESLSSASEVQLPVKKQRRRVHFDHTAVKPADDSEPTLGIDQLHQLQRHRSEITNILQYDVPKKMVQRLIRRVISQIIPKAMWGDSPGRHDDGNWKCVVKLISSMVQSRKYDVIDLNKLASGFQVKKIAWMNASGHSHCPPTELKKRRRMMAQLLSWTTSQVIFPLLRNTFYITECEGSANEVFYYPRYVWSVISSLALYDLTSFILKPISSTETSLVSQTLATSRLRLLPKATGVRPLMNLSGAVTNTQACVNKSLELVHRVLLFEIDRQAQRLLGSTVRNLDEIAAKLQAFLQSTRQCPCSRSSQFYCVTVDVERCFDTIRPKKLLRILKKVFIEDEYLVRKHWVCKGHHFKMQRPAFASGELQPFPDLIAHGHRKQGAVFVDGVLYDYISKAKILALLKEHLQANTVQVDDQLYVQRQGIPQGSVLSTTLCNLYYAYYEKRVLQKQLSETVATGGCRHELLMRYTDDFFFVTTDLAKARQFTEVIHRGNEEYGCFVNMQKSRVNFPVVVSTGHGEYDVPQIHHQASHGQDCLAPPVLAWCGLLIEPATMQVHINFDKLTLRAISASIPMDDTKKIGASFVNKVLSAVRQRWHRVYFDPATLDKSTIRLNVYQLMCLAAIRFVLLVDKLPQSSHSVAFLHAAVGTIVTKSARGILRSVCTSKNTHRVDVEDGVRLLALHSFVVVITATTIPRTQRHGRTLWDELTRLLRTDRQRLRRTMREAATVAAAAPTELDSIQSHPRNGPITRWLDAYCANFSQFSRR